MAFGELEASAQRRGVAVTTEVGWRTTSLVLTGPAPMAQWMGRVLADRLAPASLQDEGVGALADALWLDAESSLQGIVGPMGNTNNTAVAAVEGGRTAFSSRVAASRLEPALFRRLASDALADRDARVVFVGRADAIRAASSGFSAIKPTQSVPLSGVPQGGLSKPRRLVHRDALEVSQASDSHVHLTIAWTLRGLASDSGLDVPTRDAYLLALRAWLGHAGGSFQRTAVQRDGAIHGLRVALVEHNAPVLLLTGKVAVGQESEARRKVLEALAESLQHHSDELLFGARVAAADLDARLADVEGRAQMVAELLSSGRAVDSASCTQWMESVSQILNGPTPSEWVAFARAALIPERRLIVTAAPVELPKTSRLVLGGDTMRDYLRVLVDLQCPGPGFPSSVSALLREKYDMTPRHYADLTRAVARDRRLMRDLAEDAEFRCQELKRLRDLMTAERVVQLHEAVACGPTAVPSTKAARKALRRILKRYRVDKSWYRPLLGMAIELPAAKEQIDAIDARCPRAEGAH